MKRSMICLVLGVLIFVSCKKSASSSKDPAEGQVVAAKAIPALSCGKTFVAEKPVKAGETGIVLPAGTILCISADQQEVRAELPSGYAFLTGGETGKPLPVYATYSCLCSATGHCNVFYAEDMGFGCLQSSCGGSCTGKFTYKGYSVDKLVPTSSRSDFFAVPEIQKLMAEQCAQVSPLESYRALSVYGVSFYLVQDEKIFTSKAACDCEGTKACTLKSLGIAPYKTYYCDGPCNGCELTVN